MRIQFCSVVMIFMFGLSGYAADESKGDTERTMWDFMEDVESQVTSFSEGSDLTSLKWHDRTKRWILEVGCRERQ